jgi:hypothetical protein
VSDSFRLAVSHVAEADRHRLFRVVDDKPRETSQEWAEQCFVANLVVQEKHGPFYCCLVIREAGEQQALTSMDEQISLPFQTMNWGAMKYKITEIVTNREKPEEELIWSHRGRCGKCEEAHSIMKEVLA